MSGSASTNATRAHQERTPDDDMRRELARITAYAVLRVVSDDEIADMLRATAMRGLR